MSIFNVRLSKDIEARLSEEARTRQCSKSDLARDAITAFLARADKEKIEAGDIEDDWSDFGAEVIDAQRKVFERVISKLYDAEWADMVEPLYQVFRKKVIEKSKAFQTPAISLQRDGEALVSASIGFAADDDFTISVSLEDLFYTYCVDAGDEAFNEIPRIWERARIRLATGEDSSGSPS